MNISKEILIPTEFFITPTTPLPYRVPNFQTSNTFLHSALELHSSCLNNLSEFKSSLKENSLAMAIKEECQSILALLKCPFGDIGDSESNFTANYFAILVSLLRNILFLTDERYLTTTTCKELLKLSMEEEVVRVLGKSFSLSITDRSSKGEIDDFGRRWASIPIAITLFRLYHRLNHERLSQNIVRALDSAFSPDCPHESRLPPLGDFPKFIRVSYLFWRGSMALSTPVGSGGTGQWGSKADALKWLEEAYVLSSFQKKRKIAIFLILAKMSNFILPTSALLERLSLSTFYLPLILSIRHGDLGVWRAFCQDECIKSFFIYYKIWSLIKLLIYPIILRSLIRRMYFIEFFINIFSFLLQNFPSPSPPSNKMDLDFCRNVINRQYGMKIESEEMHSIISDLIYRDMVRGYVSWEHNVLVLSKKNPFPTPQNR